MIIVVLLGALTFYCVLYIAWQSAQGNMSTLAATMTVFENMLFAPQHLLFGILRALIIITVVYLFVDFIKSQRFKAAKKRQDKIDREAKLEITYHNPEDR